MQSAMGGGHGPGDAEHGTLNSPPSGGWHIFRSRSATRFSLYPSELLITLCA